MTKDEALKMALEYVELVPDDRYNAEHIDREALVTAIKEALAQPEQDGKCKYCTDGCPACDARKLPERTWVGLTDEEIGEIAIKSQDRISPHDDALRFARAIESELRSKNNV